MNKTIKIITWNVNGIRAMMNKGFYDIIKNLSPDILCIQETKADDQVVREVAAKMEGFSFLSSSAVKKGYSGTAVFTRPVPVQHFLKTGKEEHDQEGRIITVDYEKFYLINLYVPNSGQDLKRLDYRTEWDDHVLQYVKNLQGDKPVILTGDLNVAHEAIDLARPKENYNKSAGYTQAEIDGFKNYLSAGFTDIFRKAHPDKIQYTFWNQRFRARERNVGWRIDYFLVSNEMLDHVKDVYILDDIMGSDHCPVGLEITL